MSVAEYDSQYEGETDITTTKQDDDDESNNGSERKYSNDDKHNDNQSNSINRSELGEGLSHIQHQSTDLS